MTRPVVLWVGPALPTAERRLCLENSNSDWLYLETKKMNKSFCPAWVQNHRNPEVWGFNIKTRTKSAVEGDLRKPPGLLSSAQEPAETAPFTFLIWWTEQDSSVFRKLETRVRTKPHNCVFTPQNKIKWWILLSFIFCCGVNLIWSVSDQWK